MNANQNFQDGTSGAFNSSPLSADLRTSLSIFVVCYPIQYKSNLVITYFVHEEKKIIILSQLETCHGKNLHTCTEANLAITDFVHEEKKRMILSQHETRHGKNMHTYRDEGSRIGRERCEEEAEIGMVV